MLKCPLPSLCSRSLSTTITTHNDLYDLYDPATFFSSLSFILLMRFLLLFAQFAILASSLHAAPVFPSHRRIWRRQTDVSVPQPSLGATPDDIPSQLAQILSAACSAADVRPLCSSVLCVSLTMDWFELSLHAKRVGPVRGI